MENLTLTLDDLDVILTAVSERIAELNRRIQKGDRQAEQIRSMNHRTLNKIRQAFNEIEKETMTA